jgi:hypothetical protein
MMNWINFLSYLGMIYLLYYLSVYALERMTAPPSGPSAVLPVLTFSENTSPEQVRTEEVTGSSVDSGLVPAAVGLGGVSLKDLFELARKDVITYTRSVSF